MKRTLQSVARWLGLEVGRYPGEGTFRAELHRLLTTARPEVFLDVGAHHGEIAVLARSLGFRGRILAVEPDRDCLPLLESRAARDAAWQVVSSALGAVAGTAAFFRMDAPGLSSLRRPRADPGAGSLRAMTIRDTRTVEVRTLAALLRNELATATSVLAKIDAQGSDLEIMESAGAERHRIVAAVLEVPLFQIYDDMHTFPETLERMRAWGYDVTGLTPVSRDSTGRIIECDVFFRRMRGAPGREAGSTSPAR